MCVVTKDQIVLFAAEAAASKAGVVLKSELTCNQCKGSCKSIVAVDLSDPKGFYSIEQAQRRGEAQVFVAIAPEHLTTRDVKEHGFQLIVYRLSMHRLLAPVLKLAAAWVS